MADSPELTMATDLASIPWVATYGLTVPTIQRSNIQDKDDQSSFYPLLFIQTVGENSDAGTPGHSTRDVTLRIEGHFTTEAEREDFLHALHREIDRNDVYLPQPMQFDHSSNNRWEIKLVYIMRLEYSGATSVASGFTVININSFSDLTLATANVDFGNFQLNINGVLVGSAADTIDTEGGTLKIADNLEPAADSTHDLGSNTVRWTNIYGDTLHGDGSNLTAINKVTMSATVDNPADNIDKGEVVYITGSAGTKIKVGLADNTDNTKEHWIGVANSTALHNATIEIMRFGEITGIDTNAFTAGDDLWLSTTGTLTEVKPTTGAIQLIGHVVVKSVAAGVIQIGTHSEHDQAVAAGGMFRRLGTADGSTFFDIRDSANASVMKWDSNGKQITPGSMTFTPVNGDFITTLDTAGKIFFMENSAGDFEMQLTSTSGGNDDTILKFLEGSTHRANLTFDGGSNIFQIETKINDMQFKVSTADGTTGWAFLDSGDAQVFKIDSNGDLLASTTTGNTINAMIVVSDSPTHRPVINFKKQRVTGGIVADNDWLGNLDFYGFDGSNYDLGARILSQVDGTPSAGTDMPSDLSFWTSPDGTSTPVVRLTLNAAGDAIFKLGDAAGARDLSVLDSAGNEISQIRSDTIQTYCRAENATAIEGPQIRIDRARGTLGTPLVVQDDDTLGRIIFRGYSVAGTGYKVGAEIRAEIDGTPDDDATDMPGRLTFYTTPDGTAAAVIRLTLDAAGDAIFTGNIEAPSLMVGTANARYYPLTPIAFTDGDGNSYMGPISGAGMMANKIITATTTVYDSVLALPTTLGSLKLYIKSTRCMSTAADATDYVDAIELRGITSGSPPTTTQIDNNTDPGTGATNIVAPGTYDDDFGATPYDVSAYSQIGVLVRAVQATDGELRFAMQLEVYYA